MNEDALAAIEAGGLIDDLQTGLYTWERLNLAIWLNTYATTCGVAAPDVFEAIRGEARKKYPTEGEKAKLVLRALNILLEQIQPLNSFLGRSQMHLVNNVVIEKAKAALEGTYVLPSKH